MILVTFETPLTKGSIELPDAKAITFAKKLKRDYYDACIKSNFKIYKDKRAWKYITHTRVSEFYLKVNFKKL